MGAQEGERLAATGAHPYAPRTPHRPCHPSSRACAGSAQWSLSSLGSPLESRLPVWVPLVPVQVRERRRVERTLEHESCMLAAMSHQNIVGFRAAQRASDGHLCLALEHCEISLYQLIQERVKPHGGCVSPTREARAGEVFSAAETAQIAHAIAAGLAYLHGSHRLMHGDVKSANILLARDLSRIKLCDLGVSIPLKHDLSRPLEPGSMYEGTEPWRPPEALRSDGDSEEGDGSDSACAEGMHLCDRTDIFAFGLVLWEMLAGDVRAVSCRPSPPYHRFLLRASPSITSSFLASCRCRTPQSWRSRATKRAKLGRVPSARARRCRPYRPRTNGSSASSAAVRARPAAQPSPDSPALAPSPLTHRRVWGRMVRAGTQRLPDRRPSAAELLTWLQPDSTIEPPGDVS